jgi:P-type Cu2+ transporter
MNAPSCSHCHLPIGAAAHARDVNGEARGFCCYGCCLAWQVGHGERDEPEAAWLLIRIGVGCFLAMFIMLFSLLLYSGTFGPTEGGIVRIVHLILWALATPLLVVLGGPFVRGAWQQTRRGRLGADTLISLGAVSAYGYSAFQVLRGGDGVYFDTMTMVLVLFTLGRYLEAQGRVQAMRSLAPMLEAERATVDVFEAGAVFPRPIQDVRAGTIVRVLPGERIAVDGIVTDGNSECDESVLTGQPEEQFKLPGSRVHAGSINGHGALLVMATVAGTDTRWIRISRMVRAALAGKSRLGNLIDHAAGLFVPFVLLLAAATVWYWSARLPLEAALLGGLAVLVVACPCSLGLAAPLATALGIGRAARRGILVRGGDVFERLARVRSIAFDKTGTLTQGRPQPMSLATDGATESEVLRRAGALAAGSEHAMARAVAVLAQAKGLAVPRALEVRVHPGAGVSGMVEGMPCAMGSDAFIARLGWSVPATLSWAACGAECSRVYVAWGGRVHGLVALADAPLPEARDVIASLHERGMATLLLSGDAPGPVAAVAAALAIPVWRAELTPEGKVEVLRGAAGAAGPFAMVGDGLNDGPVLAGASVGIAVGAATDLARESADVTLPPGGLANLPWLVQLAKDVRRSILANLAWALAYNALALSLAVAGLLQPVIAAGLMFGSSVVVVVRSLRAGREVRAQASADTAAEREARHAWST